MYKGHKVVPYCPRCGTSLSSHEVAQGYRNIKERSIYVRFRTVEDPDTYFAALDDNALDVAVERRALCQ